MHLSAFGLYPKLITGVKYLITFLSKIIVFGSFFQNMAEDGGFSSQMPFNSIMGHVVPFHRLLLTVFIFIFYQRLI